MRKRRFIPPLMAVYQMMVSPKACDINPFAEDMLLAIQKKEEISFEAEKAKEIMTPKQYGIRKLGKRSLKVARK